MYDVAIIGGGISGLMTAYRLSEKSNYKILILERGKKLEERICPIIEKGGSCIKCEKCSIMEGMAGAGAFSDGKYNITTEFGGWLPDYIDDKKVMDYIRQCDDILVEHGATTEKYMPNDDLKQECLKYDLHMLQAEVKHIGTDQNLIVMGNLIKTLKQKGVDIITEAIVTDVNKDTKNITYSKDGKNNEVIAKNIVFAVGRMGSSFLSKWCSDNDVKCKAIQIDLGVRVELPYLVWKKFSEKIYEPKIVYRTKQYGDRTRSFCFNEKGSVVMENTGGILTVNGHSYKDEKKKTQNSNFAILSTTKFTEPFDEPIEYGKYISSLANKISGGGVIVQRFGDLVNGRRTNQHRLNQSTVRPTLDAVPGDLSLCLPKRQLDNIIETIYALDKVAPGTANYDTLLYGVECKYYSARPNMNDFELEGLKGIYAIGDGAGVTRSLAQAAANGLYVADKILKGE